MAFSEILTTGAVTRQGHSLAKLEYAQGFQSLQFLTVGLFLGVGSAFVSSPLTSGVVVLSWSVAVVFYLNKVFGALQMHYPVVALWWLGLFPTTLSLLFFRSQNVGIDIVDYPAVPLVLISGTCAVAVGGLLTPAGCVRAQIAADVRLPNSTLNRILGFGILLCWISAFANFLIVRKYGNPYEAINPEAQRTSFETGNGAILTIAFSSLIVGVCLASIGISSASYVRRTHFWAVALVYAFTVGVSLVATALTGTRSLLVKAIIVMVLSLCLSRYRRVKGPLIGACLVLVAILAAALGQRRYVGSSLSMTEILVQRMSSNLQVGGLIYDYSTQNEPWFGRALMTPFLTYFPGPQLGLGYQLKDALGLKFSGGGVATPLALEGYLDFRWAGVIVYGALAGCVCAAIAWVMVYLRDWTGYAFMICVGIMMVGAASGLGTALAVYGVPTAAMAALCLLVLRIIGCPHQSEGVV